MEYPIKSSIKSNKTEKEIDCFVLAEVKAPNKENEGYILMMQKSEIIENLPIDELPDIEGFMAAILKQKFSGKPDQFNAMVDYSYNDYVYVAQNYMGLHKNDVSIGFLNKNNKSYELTNFKHVETLGEKIANFFSKS